MVYFDEGSGPPIVMIPGLSADHLAWEQTQVPDFLSAGFRCIGIDNRDCGQSQVHSRQHYTIADMADDTASIIRASASGPAHIFGISMGGMIAQELAIRSPEFVRSLTLYGTDCGPTPWLRAVVDSWLLVRRSVSAVEFFELLCPQLFTREFYETPGVVDVLRDTASSNPFPQSADAFERQCRALFTHETRDRIGKIGQPVHVIVGETDFLQPVSNSEEIVRRIPGAKLTVLPKLGHAAMWENPGLFNTHVLAFWKTVQVAGQA